MIDAVLTPERHHGTNHDAVQRNDTQRKTQLNAPFGITTVCIMAECCYAECRGATRTTFSDFLNKRPGRPSHSFVNCTPVACTINVCDHNL